MPEDYLEKFGKIISGKLQALNDYHIKMLKEGISVIPVYADLVGYKTLIEFIEKHDVHNIEGDFVEIGTLFGGGAATLSKFIETKCPDKKLMVIDIFDIEFDQTVDTDGNTMANTYKRLLSHFDGKNQQEVFELITSDCKNLILFKEDSKNVKFDNCICFAFIDGNHSTAYLENDFYLVWNKLSEGGCIAFHDYGGDLRNLTDTIDLLVKKHQGEIAYTEFYEPKNIFYLIKK